MFCLLTWEDGCDYEVLFTRCHKLYYCVLMSEWCFFNYGTDFAKQGEEHIVQSFHSDFSLMQCYCKNRLEVSYNCYNSELAQIWKCKSNWHEIGRRVFLFPERHLRAVTWEKKTQIFIAPPFKGSVDVGSVGRCQCWGQNRETPQKVEKMAEGLSYYIVYLEYCYYSFHASLKPILTR